MVVLALQFANGNVFFVGLLLSICGVLFTPLFRRRIARSLVNVVTLLGALFVLLSATPLPLWLYGLWLLLLVTAHAFMASSTKARERLRVYLGGVFLACSLTMLVWEIPYHLTPRMVRPPSGTVFVVGDSLSMGADTQEQNWPGLLGQKANLKVFNYSFGGAKAGTALDNAKRVDSDGSLVILEIGGNDILSKTDVSQYETELEEMLSIVCRGNRSVAMLELPLPPFFNKYGEVQRRLARAHAVTLIPKRYLTKVMGTPGATFDGLHFTHEGHALMADLLFALMSE